MRRSSRRIGLRFSEGAMTKTLRRSKIFIASVVQINVKLHRSDISLGYPNAVRPTTIDVATELARFFLASL
jgi:hypothetical protein